MSPDYIEVMRRALPFLNEDSSTNRSPLKWAELPGISCQAAGGDPRWVDALAAAWLLYYVAAHIMDKVEDQDILEGTWKDWEAGSLVNAASGLYFSAALLLNELHVNPQTSSSANEINRDIFIAFLKMCSGQQRDLSLLNPSLSDYWQNAADKSGVFFSMACRLGARAATPDIQILDGYQEFGLCLGILIQILDDLQEFQDSGKMFGIVHFQALRRSLPVIYALEVLPDQSKERLLRELSMASDPQAAQEAFKIIDESGSATYMISEMERLRSRAINSLARARPISPVNEKLLSYLEDLTYHF